MRDRNTFRLVSTFDQPGSIKKQSYEKKKNTKGGEKKFIYEKVEKEVPYIVDTYNKNMGGVDKADQCIKYYSTCRKTRKWTIKVFFYIFDIRMFNAFSIYKIKFSDNIQYKTMLDFRIYVMDLLFGVSYLFSPKIVDEVNVPIDPQQIIIKIPSKVIIQTSIHGVVHKLVMVKKGLICSICKYNGPLKQGKIDTECNITRQHMCRKGCLLTGHSHKQG